MKPVVSKPATASSPGGAYDPNAAKLGLKIPPNESQNVPKVLNTTAGNVLPRIHSIMAPRIMRIPPWKKYTGL